MPEHDVEPGQNEQAGTEQADAYKALLSDAPSDTHSDKPEDLRIQDSEEAREVAEVGKVYRERAAKARSDAERTADALHRGQALDRSEANDKHADGLEGWMQAIQKHPELAGKAFDGEPITPQSLEGLSKKVAELEKGIQQLEERATRVASRPYNLSLDAEFMRLRLGYGGETAPLVPNADAIIAELERKGADDTTTMGEMKQVLIDGFSQAAQLHKDKIEPMRQLLDVLRS